MKKKWFQQAIRKRPPYKLGWKKTQSTNTRRRNALSSRPKNWSLNKKRLSAGRALIALANVTKDKRTKELAKKDASYFFKKKKKKKR